MIDAPYAYAFTVGMVATVNPCGFAMLPAYLGFFLGSEDPVERDMLSSLLRALVVGAAVSAGFLSLFAVVGLIFSGTSVFFHVSPWLTVIIGLALIGVGMAMALGWSPSFLLPRLDKGGRDRTLWSMFLFGLSYAVASLSCTLPVFSSVVASAFTRDSFGSGLATFGAYGLGMALLLMVLTVTLALARQGLSRTLRRALPYVHRVSGVIMALVGIYLAWYGVFEIRTLQRNEQVDAAGPFKAIQGWSPWMEDRLRGIDSLQFALAAGVVITGLVLAALIRADRRAQRRAEAESESGVSDASSEVGDLGHDGSGDQAQML